VGLTGFILGIMKNVFVMYLRCSCSNDTKRSAGVDQGRRSTYNILDENRATILQRFAMDPRTCQNTVQGNTIKAKSVTIFNVAIVVLSALCVVQPVRKGSQDLDIGRGSHQIDTSPSEIPWVG
jgi:hypothetical protein